MPSCVVSEGGCYFQGWFFKGGLPFIVSCVIPLLNQIVSSLIMTVWLLAFPSDQLLCWITKSCFLKSVTVLLQFVAAPLYFTHCISLAEISFQFKLKVLTEVTLPDTEANPGSLTGFLMSGPVLVSQIHPSANIPLHLRQYPIYPC